MRRLAAALLTLLPLMLRAQTYTETEMVNTTIQRPDGVGFFSPVGNPSLEGNNLVFFSQTPTTGIVDSLWVQNTATGAFIKLAGTSTAAPGGSGNFSGFSYGPKDQLEPELRNGTVIFYGVDSASVLGLYTVPVAGGAVSLIARTGGTCPSGGTFTSLSLQSFDENYSIDSGKVLFNAQCSATGGYGLYAANVDGTGLATVINPTLLIPYAPRMITYGGWQNAPLSNGATAILGTTVNDPSRGPNAIYAATLTGGAQTSGPVVDDLLPLPGDINPMPHWEIGQFELSGTQIVFTGSDSLSGATTPAYYAIFQGSNVPGGGTINKVADTNTALPGTVKLPITAFTRLAFASGTLAFGAYGSDNIVNVYMLNKGALVPVAHSSSSDTDYPGGFYTYNLWPLNRYAVSNGSVAFRVSNQVAGAIMLASPVSTSVITAVTNSASYTSKNVAPGEIITVFGSNLAPAGPGPGGVTTFTLDSTQHVPTLLAGTRLLVNGIPAPLLYVSPTQLSAIVPYELLATQPTQAYFSVASQGGFSAGFTLPVATEAPGLFSINATGSGPGAILNQDGSINSGSNPAAAGTTISLFGTGDGEEDPIPATGSVNSSTPPFPNSLHFGNVMIGGVPAQITYRGAAPGAVAGLFQINATIPTGLAPGNQPVVAQYDAQSTQTGLTVAVK
jgi:uncharacterized protein (TIGR03437 family)